MSSVHHFRASIEEAFITVEAALASADMVARFGITESRAFDQMMNFLLDASALLSKILAVEAVETTIFPTVQSGRSAVANAPKFDGLGFEFVRDGAGRCAVRLVIADEKA